MPAGDFEYEDDGEAVTLLDEPGALVDRPAHSIEVRIGTTVRTCDVLDGAILSYGRQRVTEATDPAHAALVIAGALQAGIGDQVEVDVITAGAGRRRRFTGTITDLDVSLDPDVSQTRIVAVSAGLGALSRRLIGAEPWPAEPAGARIARHLDLAGVPAGDVDVDVVDVIAEDRDRTEALDLAQTAAADALGVLVDEVDGRVSYHAAARRDVAATLNLDACEVEEGSAAWQRVGDLINRARASYGDDGTGNTVGEAMAEDPTSIARFGAYEISRRTTLAAEIDAETIVERAVALYSWPAWSAPRWQIPLHVLDPARADQVAALRISDRVTLSSLPAPLPASMSAYVEGWTETLTYYTRDLDLYLSDSALSFPVLRWRDLDPATPTWSDLDPATPTWSDLWTGTLP